MSFLVLVEEGGGGGSRGKLAPKLAPQKARWLLNAGTVNGSFNCYVKLQGESCSQVGVGKKTQGRLINFQ